MLGFEPGWENDPNLKIIYSEGEIPEEYKHVPVVKEEELGDLFVPFHKREKSGPRIKFPSKHKVKKYWNKELKILRRYKDH